MKTGEFGVYTARSLTYVQSTILMCCYCRFFFSSLLCCKLHSRITELKENFKKDTVCVVVLCSCFNFIVITNNEGSVTLVHFIFSRSNRLLSQLFPMEKTKRLICFRFVLFFFLFFFQISNNCSTIMSEYAQYTSSGAKELSSGLTAMNNFSSNQQNLLHIFKFILTDNIMSHTDTHTLIACIRSLYFISQHMIEIRIKPNGIMHTQSTCFIMWWIFVWNVFEPSKNSS